MASKRTLPHITRQTQNYPLFIMHNMQSRPGFARYALFYQFDWIGKGHLIFEFQQMAK